MNDSEIVQLFFDGNEQGISEAAKKYGGYCKAIALNIVKNAEEADDIVNDTYMKAWESIPPQRPAALGAFLGRIAKHCALNRVKSEQAQKRGNNEIPLIFDELSELISDGSNVENAAETKEIIRVVNEYLRELPNVSRDVFILRYWYCYTNSEIANRLNLREGNVRAILSRTRKKLKKYLNEEGYEL